MEFHLIDFIEYALNAVVLFVLLRAFLYKPVSAFMAARSEKFALERAGLDAGRAEAEALKAQYEGSLREAERAAEACAQERLTEAAHEAEDIRAQALAEAKRALENAKVQAGEERDEMLSDLRRDTASLAVELAGRILAREVSAADNQRLIDGFFEQVG